MVNKTINQFLGFLGECMGKQLTYDDVLAEAVYSVLETLRIKNQEKIIEEIGTSDVLVMDNNELGSMVLTITSSNPQYLGIIDLKFKELKQKYLLGGVYDSSGETINEIPKVKNHEGEVYLF